MTLIGIGKQTLSLGADIQGREPGGQHILIALPPGVAREIPLREVILAHHCGHTLNRREEGGETILQCKNCKQEVRLASSNMKTVGDLLKHRAKDITPGGQLGCL